MNRTATAQNIETVQKIYAAFGRGDVAAILEQLAENVEWNNAYNLSRELPWYGNFSGRRNVPGFFASIAEHIDIPRFDPKVFTHDDHHVAVQLSIEVVMKKNGKKVVEDVMHFWTFDAAGKVTAYRHFNDTAAELAAWRG